MIILRTKKFFVLIVYLFKLVGVNIIFYKNSEKIRLRVKSKASFDLK